MTMEYSMHHEPPYAPTLTVTVRRNSIVERLGGVWILLTTGFYWRNHEDKKDL